MLFITYFWWQACKVWKIYRKLKKEGKAEKKVFPKSNAESL